MEGDQIKQLLGRTVAERFVASGMKIGLGTGSTAVWAIRRIGELLAGGSLSALVGVPTSSQAEVEAHAVRIPLRTMNDPEIGGELDLTIDGADEVDAAGNLTKGGGGALLIEKVVAYASRRVVIIVGREKLVDHLGLTFPIPIEVIPSARVPVTRALERMGISVQLRMAVRKMGAVITDNGNVLLDATLPAPTDIAALERDVKSIPGVVENGVFSRANAEVYYGTEEGRVIAFKPAR